MIPIKKLESTKSASFLLIKKDYGGLIQHSGDVVILCKVAEK